MTSVGVDKVQVSAQTTQVGEFKIDEQNAKWVRANYKRP